MANLDQRSPALNLPLPVVSSNSQDYDVPRLAEALVMLDGIISALRAAVDGKAADGHRHQIEDVTGLSEALSSKAPLDFRPLLRDLPDVDVSAASQRMVLMRIGEFWQSARLLLSDVEGWENTVDAKIAAAVDSVVASSPAALDTLQELSAALGNDPSFATTISASLGNRLRGDAAQAWSAGQQAQAQTNLGISALIRALLDDTTEDAALTTLGVGAGLRGIRAAADAASIFATIKQGASDAETGVVELATPTEAAAGADTRRAVTPAGVAAAIAALTTPGLGVGQTWSAPSRSIGTTYQNLTGRPIEVLVSVATTAGGVFDLQISNNGTTWLSVASVGVASIRAAMSMVVPKNDYYRVSGSGGGVLLWSELR